MHIRKMALQASFSKRTFTFEFDARTSRGLMREKHSWYIKIWDDPKVGRFGVGECGPLPGLSIEDSATIEEKISSVVEQINHAKLKLADVDSSSLKKLNTFLTGFFGEELMEKYPSVVFSLETAILDLLNGGDRVIFRNEFTKGKPLPINGLIWMGGLDFVSRDEFEGVKAMAAAAREEVELLKARLDVLEGGGKPAPKRKSPPAS